MHYPQAINTQYGCGPKQLFPVLTCFWSITFLALFISACSRDETQTPEETPALTFYTQQDGQAPEHHTISSDVECVLSADTLDQDSIFWTWKMYWPNSSNDSLSLELSIYSRLEQGLSKDQVLSRLLGPRTHSWWNGQRGRDGAALLLTRQGLILDSRHAPDSLKPYFNMQVDFFEERVIPGSSAKSYWVTGKFSGYVYPPSGSFGRHLVGQGQFKGPA